MPFPNLFGPPNVDKLKAARNTSALIKALSYQKDSSIPKSAVQALGDLGDKKAVDALMAVLKERSGSIRDAAAEALGKIGDTKAIALLQTSLWQTFEKSADKSLREAATSALIKMGAPSIEGFVQAFGTTLEKALHAASALEKMGEVAVEPLIAALKHTTLPIRAFATATLGNLGSKEAVPHLIPLLKDKQVSNAAIAALGKLGDSQAIAPLAEAYPNAPVIAQNYLAEALKKLNWEPQEQTQKLDFYVRSKQWDKVVKAGTDGAAALVGVFKSQTTPPENNELVSMSDGVVDALAQIGEAAVEPLINVITDKEAWWLKISCAVQALAKIGDKRAVEPLITLLEHPDESVIKKTVIALDDLKDERAVSALTKLLENDDEDEIPEAAAHALGNIGGEEAAKALVHYLESMDGEVLYENVFETVVKSLTPMAAPWMAAPLKAVNAQLDPEFRQYLRPLLRTVSPSKPHALAATELASDVVKVKSLLSTLSVGSAKVGLSEDGERLLFVTVQRLPAHELLGLKSAVESGHIQLRYRFDTMPAYPVFAFRINILDNPSNPFWLEVFPDFAGPEKAIFSYVSQSAPRKFCFHFYDPGKCVLFEAGYELHQFEGLDLDDDLKRAEHHADRISNKNYLLGVEQFSQRYS